MLKTKRRTAVFRQGFKFKPLDLYKIAVTIPVSVKDPSSGKIVESTVVTFKEEPLIDSHLKSSDFALEVQLRNGQQLQDCRPYLEPSTPEEFQSIMINGLSSISKLSQSVQEPRQPSADPVQPSADPVQSSVQEPKSE